MDILRLTILFFFVCATPLAAQPEGELQSQLGHSAQGVPAVAISPDGRLLATGGSDSDVKLWLTESGHLWRNLIGHGSSIQALAFSPDGQILASVSDRSLRFWDVGSGLVLKLQTLPLARIQDVAFDPRGELVATAQSDHTVILWSAATRDPLFRFEAPELEDPSGFEDESRRPGMTGTISVAFDEQGDRLVSGHSERGVMVWDLSSGDLAARLAYEGTPFSVAFSPGGSRIAAAGSDRRILLWDARTGERLATLEGHTDTVRDLVFLPAGGLVSAGLDSTVRWWSEGGERHLQRLAGGVYGLAYGSRSGHLAVSGSGSEIRLVDVGTRETLRIFGFQPTSVNGLAFSPDGRYLAVATSAPEIALLDLASGRLARTLAGHGQSVTAVEFSPDGDLLVSRSEDNTLRLWRWPSGKPAEVFDVEKGSPFVFDVELSPDGKTLAIGQMPPAGESAKVLVWDLEDRARRSVLSPSGVVQGLAFSRDGAKLAVASLNLKGGYQIWDVATGKVRTEVDPPYTFRDGQVVDVPFACTVVFSADGESLFGGTSNGLIYHWDLETRAILGVVEHGSLSSQLALSPDGRRLVSGGQEAEVRIWNAETLELVQTLAGPGSYVSGIRFEPDGRSLAVGSRDGTLRLFRLADGELVTLTHFLPEGEYLTQTAAGDYVASSGAGRYFGWRHGFEVRSFSELAESEDSVARALAGRSILEPGPPETELSEEEKRRLAEAIRLNERVADLASRGRHREAAELAEDALEIQQQVYGAGHRRITFPLFLLGDQLRKLKQYGRAESLFLRALEIWEAHGAEKSEYAALLSNTGDLYRELGQFEKALDYQRRAYDTWHQSLSRIDHYPVILNNLALALIGLERLDEAERALGEALAQIQNLAGADPDLARALGPQLADVMDNMATLHLARGNDRTAEDLYRRAEVVRAGGTPPPKIPEAAREMAEAAETADEITRQMLDDFTGPVQIPSSPQPGRTGLPAAPPSQFGDEPGWRTEIRIRPGRRDRPAIGGHDERGAADTQSGLGNLALKRGQFQEARRHYDAALELLRGSVGSHHPDVGAAMGNLARIKAATWRTAADLVDAVSLYSEAFGMVTDFLESVLLESTESEKATLLETEGSLSVLFDQALSLAADLPQGSPALRELYDTVLKRKLLTFRALSRQLETYFSGAEGSAKLLEDYRDLLRQVSALRYGTTALDPIAAAQLQALTRQLEAKEDEMTRESARFELDWRARRASAADVLGAVPENSVVVDFVRYRHYDFLRLQPTEYRYLAFVLLSSGELRVKNLGKAETIEAQVEAYHSEIGRFDPRNLGLVEQRESEAALSEPCRALYRLLLAPLAGLLPESGSVFLVPDGTLHLVPFETFLDGGDRYLVDRYQFTYLGSARDLLHFQESGQVEGFYVFAAPDYGEGGQFEPLNGTADLAEVLRGLFDLEEDHVFLGKEASEENLYRLRRPRWLHVATHGFFGNIAPEVGAAFPVQPENPLLLAGLALSGANRMRLRPSIGDPADGIATALEILTALDLRGTELVVLSACETGVGEVRPSEGVFGLSRAIRAAGAQSVAMSLWQVEDKVTERLMTHFYHGLEAGQGRSEALRQAALSIKAEERYSHPYFWGAFVYAGSPS
jgi:WD40 repeat protein/CHAT domain-containing protein